MPMEIILLERVPNLGQMGDVVKVKPGYARNYLLPEKKALRATDANRAYFDKQRAHLEAVNLERRKDAEGIAGKVDGMAVRIIRQAGDTGQLYGSVTVRDLADAISAAGVAVDRRQIALERPIKTLGLHPIRVVLHPEVVVTVTANVARSQDEADRQARGESATERTEAEEEAEEAFGGEAAAEELFERPPAETAEPAPER